MFVSACDFSIICPSVCLSCCLYHGSAVAAVVHGEVSKSLEQMVFGDDDDDAEQQNMCIVCWTMERETTLAPCGHRVLCR